MKFHKHIGNKGISIIGFTVLAYLFVALSIVLFLTFFKYHLGLYVNDQINWNQYEEIPMSFIVATPNGRPLVVDASKVFNGFMKQDDFTNQMREFPRLFSNCYLFNVTDGKGKIEWFDMGKECVVNEQLYYINYPYPLSFNLNSLYGNITMKIFPFNYQGTNNWPRCQRC